MSAFLFPVTLPGIQYDYIRSYEWNTGVQTAVSGKTSTIAYRLYPLVHFEYSFEFLKDTNSPADIKAVVGLFNAVRGRQDSFLHTDPDFNTIASSSPQQFATADGTGGPFQIVAYYQNSGGPGQAEIMQNFSTLPVIYDNGSVIPSANYVLTATGQIAFFAGHFPTSGHALSWSGSFYYRCRFDADHYDWKKFMNGFWSADKLTFTSCIL